jgi:hypothetical protein
MNCVRTFLANFECKNCFFFFLLVSKKNKNKNLFFWGRDWKVALKWRIDGNHPNLFFPVSLFWVAQNVPFPESPKPGLPDGRFSDQKSQFGYIFEGLGMKNDIFYGHLQYCSAVWYVYICHGYLVYCVLIWYFWYVEPRKIWQPCS